MCCCKISWAIAFCDLKGIQPLPSSSLLSSKTDSCAVYWFVSGCLFHFIWTYSRDCASPCQLWTYCNCYFHTSQDGCTSLLLVGSAMNPLVSLLFTKPKQSHNDIKSDLCVSKDHLVLVPGQEVNSLTVILWFRDHSDTIHHCFILALACYTQSHSQCLMMLP